MNKGMNKGLFRKRGAMKRTAMILVSLVLVSGTSAWSQSPAKDKEEDLARQGAEQALERAKTSLEQLVQNNPSIRLAQPGTAIRPIMNIPNLAISTNFPGFYSRSDTPLYSLQIAPGTWWTNAENAAALGLTKEQQKKMDDIFQQHRLKLIDLNASLSKEEAILDPLIASERLDEPKILFQIDRIAQARAELEKANSRLLLAIRQSLTMEQWTKLQANPRLIHR